MDPVRPHLAPQTATWQDLQAICTARSSGSAPFSLGLPAIDTALPSGGLAADGVHEWFGTETPNRPRDWVPPLTILSHLATQATSNGGSLLWIGEKVWPHPPTLAARDLLIRSLFVRAANPSERLWAADLALRSGGGGGSRESICAVIADGSRFDLSATRRLQLAAEAGGVPCFLVRPPWERPELSAATTRWHVAVAARDPDRSHPPPARRWTVELLRCKGVQPSPAAPRRWLLEQVHAKGDGLVAAELLDGPCAPAALPRRQSG